MQRPYEFSERAEERTAESDFTPPVKGVVDIPVLGSRIQRRSHQHQLSSGDSSGYIASSDSSISDIPGVHNEDTIESCRSKINAVDEQLITLLNERASIAVEIGKIKRRNSNRLAKQGNHQLVIDPAREQEVIQRAVALSKGPLPPRCLEEIMREIMSACKMLQYGPKEVSIGYLGPAGSFSHEAARKQFGLVNCIPYDSIRLATLSVTRGDVSMCVIPVENSTIGSIGESLDALVEFRNDVFICGELQLAVRLALVGPPEASVSTVRRIISKPEARRQCMRFIQQYCPGAQLVDSLSTSAAVRAVAELAASDADLEEGGYCAAIASENAVPGSLRVLASGIQDQSHNRTRFAVLCASGTAASCVPRSGLDKTVVIVFCGPHLLESPRTAHKGVSTSAAHGHSVNNQNTGNGSTNSSSGRSNWKEEHLVGSQDQNVDSTSFSNVAPSGMQGSASNEGGGSHTNLHNATTQTKNPMVGARIQRRQEQARAHDRQEGLPAESDASTTSPQVSSVDSMIGSEGDKLRRDEFGNRYDGEGDDGAVSRFSSYTDDVDLTEDQGFSGSSMSTDLNQALMVFQKFGIDILSIERRPYNRQSRGYVEESRPVGEESAERVGNDGGEDVTVTKGNVIMRKGKPIPATDFSYAVVIELAGHLSDQRIHSAIHELHSRLVVIGSFPVARRVL